MFLRKEYKSKSDVFSNELDIMSSVYGEYLSSSFNSDFIGHDFNYLLELIPNKIFIEPASSSGKYHPVQGLSCQSSFFQIQQTGSSPKDPAHLP